MSPAKAGLICPRPTANRAVDKHVILYPSAEKKFVVGGISRSARRSPQRTNNQARTALTGWPAQLSSVGLAQGRQAGRMQPSAPQGSHHGLQFTAERQ
jgi:hypothetical protein